MIDIIFVLLLQYKLQLYEYYWSSNIETIYIEFQCHQSSVEYCLRILWQNDWPHCEIDQNDVLSFFSWQLTLFVDYLIEIYCEHRYFHKDNDTFSPVLLKGPWRHWVCVTKQLYQIPIAMPITIYNLVFLLMGKKSCNKMVFRGSFLMNDIVSCYCVTDQLIIRHCRMTLLMRLVPCYKNNCM